MEYLLLIHNDEKSLDAMPEETLASVMKEFGAFNQGMIEKGQLRAGNQLSPTDTARTVRYKDGKPATTDGPFAEIKEALGGYYIIEAKDIDEALEVASRVPSILGGDGGVEVRPLIPMICDRK